MRRLIGVVPLPSFGVQGALTRTRQRFERLKAAGQPQTPCGDCGHALTGRWVEGERMICTNCGSDFEVYRIEEDADALPASTNGEADKNHDAVLAHRKFARDYVLWLYAAVAIGTLVAILNRSMLTLTVTATFPFVLGPAAFLHRCKARLLENGQGSGRPSFRALMAAAFGRGNGSGNGRQN